MVGTYYYTIFNCRFAIFGENYDDAVVTRHTPCVCRGEMATGDERLNGTLSHWYAHDTRSQTSSRIYLYVRTIAGTYTYMRCMSSYTSRIMGNYWALSSSARRRRCALNIRHSWLRRLCGSELLRIRQVNCNNNMDYKLQTIYLSLPLNRLLPSAQPSLIICEKSTCNYTANARERRRQALNGVQKSRETHTYHAVISSQFNIITYTKCECIQLRALPRTNTRVYYYYYCTYLFRTRSVAAALC